MGPAIAAVCVAGILIFVFAFIWGRLKGKAAEDKVIREALENAGMAREVVDQILASPLEPAAGLFDDWVQDDNHKGPTSVP